MDKDAITRGRSVVSVYFKGPYKVLGGSVYSYDGDKVLDARIWHGLNRLDKVPDPHAIADRHRKTEDVASFIADLLNRELGCQPRNAASNTPEEQPTS